MEDAVARRGQGTIEESWNTLKYSEAKKLRDTRARELRGQGWNVKTQKFDFQHLGAGTLYKLKASWPAEVTVLQ